MSFVPMLHSVSYSGSWGQAALSLEQFIDRAADLGFGGVMLMSKRPHLSVLDWDAKARTSCAGNWSAERSNACALPGITT